LEAKSRRPRRPHQALVPELLSGLVGEDDGLLDAVEHLVLTLQEPLNLARMLGQLLGYLPL